LRISPYIRLLRIPHWIKNIFIFVPLVYSRNLFHWEYTSVSLLAFAGFCFASSLVYILNDIVDKERDRLHPKKRLRPIASGEVTTGKANILMAVFALLTIAVSLFLAPLYQLIITGYILLNMAYSFWLKDIVLLDIFSIAGGFILRVWGGTVAIAVEASSWLMLITLFISLFLAVMKRMSESELLDSEEQEQQLVRKVLENYSKRFIDQISAVSAGSVIVFYAMYTVAPRTIKIFDTEDLIYTTLFVVFGIFRYMYLVHRYKKGESTIEILLKDAPTIVNAIFYISTTILIVYKVI